MPRIKGEVIEIIQRVTNSGKNFWSVTLEDENGDSIRGSIWNKPNIEEGDNVVALYEEKGQYTNWKNFKHADNGKPEAIQEKKVDKPQVTHSKPINKGGFREPIQVARGEAVTSSAEIVSSLIAGKFVKDAPTAKAMVLDIAEALFEYAWNGNTINPFGVEVEEIKPKRKKKEKVEGIVEEEVKTETKEEEESPFDDEEEEVVTPEPSDPDGEEDF